MPFQITTKAFSANGPIPKRYTCDGENVSPALAWSGAPEGTRSYSLIVDDPDAPAGTWNHWLLYDIPADVHALQEGAPPIGVCGTNDFRRTNYGGPCPPRGHGPHRYYFRLHAVDRPSLGLKPGARRGELDAALQGRVLAKAEWVGTYERK